VVIPKTFVIRIASEHDGSTFREGVLMKSQRVALYARVSTDAQTTENQLLQLRAVAERHGWPIVAEFPHAPVQRAHWF
jgi:predicted site-specific integrase-resolvase